MAPVLRLPTAVRGQQPAEAGFTGGMEGKAHEDEVVGSEIRIGPDHPGHRLLPVGLRPSGADGAGG